MIEPVLSFNKHSRLEMKGTERQQWLRIRVDFPRIRPLRKNPEPTFKKNRIRPWKKTWIRPSKKTPDSDPNLENNTGPYLI